MSEQGLSDAPWWVHIFVQMGALAIVAFMLYLDFKSETRAIETLITHYQEQNALLREQVEVLKSLAGGSS